MNISLLVLLLGCWLLPCVVRGTRCFYYEGKIKNDGVCVCGTTQCTSATGFFCIGTRNRCLEESIADTTTDQGNENTGAACRSIARIGTFCGNGKIYNPLTGASNCATTPCGQPDITTCCIDEDDTNSVTCNTIAGDTTFCGFGKAYNSANAANSCGSSPCDSGDIATCCIDTVTSGGTAGNIGAPSTNSATTAAACEQYKGRYPNIKNCTCGKNLPPQGTNNCTSANGLFCFGKKSRCSKEQMIGSPGTRGGTNACKRFQGKIANDGKCKCGKFIPLTGTNECDLVNGLFCVSQFSTCQKTNATGTLQLLQFASLPPPPEAACRTIASIPFCGVGKIYNPLAAASLCATRQCDPTTDNTTCCIDEGGTDKNFCS